LETEKRIINRINLITYLIRLADRFGSNEIADYILSLVKKEKTRWINELSLRVLSSALSRVGSLKSIPSLKEIVSISKKSDTILYALGAINKINGKKELDYFIACYHEKRDSSVKRNLIKLIAALGNENQFI